MSHKSVAVNITVRYHPTLCHWVVEHGNSEEPYFVTDGSPDVVPGRNKSAWDVRDEFLTVRDRKQLLSFLKRTGRFTTYADHERWSLREFATWQDIIRSISEVRPEQWGELISRKFTHVDQSDLISKFQTKFPVYFGKEGKFYLGRISVANTLQAMIVSVYIDWMAGIEVGFCARHDCRKPYEVTTSHKRKYCTPECAHHEVVRRSRSRAKARESRDKMVGQKIRVKRTS